MICTVRASLGLDLLCSTTFSYLLFWEFMFWQRDYASGRFLLGSHREVCFICKRNSDNEKKCHSPVITCHLSLWRLFEFLPKVLLIKVQHIQIQNSPKRLGKALASLEQSWCPWHWITAVPPCDKMGIRNFKRLGPHRRYLAPNKLQWGASTSAEVVLQGPAITLHDGTIVVCIWAPTYTYVYRRIKTLMRHILDTWKLMNSYRGTEVHKQI